MAYIDGMTAEDRARTCDLLALALTSPPTEESVVVLHGLAQALGVDCPQDLSLDEIRREFMDLLVVPGPRYVAPYESAYCDDRLIQDIDGSTPRSAGLLMGDSTLAVRQAFVDAGVLPLRDLPDHIANELRLVSHLWYVEASADAGQALETAQRRRRFVEEHPLRWIGELGGRIAQRSVTGFYGAVVAAAETLLDAEFVAEECARSS